MTQLIPFESAKLPAHLAALKVSNDLASGGGGFPVISIKGKVFTLKRGDDKKLITKPDSPDEPAASLEVVILKAYPEGGKTAKVYYETGYTEGSDASPTCYSNDGVAPAADAETPQAKTCATCPHNQWGSKITENGAKGKACGDTKRLAVAAPNAINDPMLLRVPAASLKALSQFGDLLTKRGVPYQAVVTKIGFDYTVAHPALTFKPVGFVDEATLTEVVGTVESDLVKQITGQIETPHGGKPFEQPAPEPKAKPAAAKPAPKPAAKPAAKPAPVEDDDLPTTPRTRVKVEGEEEEAAKPAPKKAAPVVEDAEQGMGDILDSIDFDD